MPQSYVQCGGLRFAKTIGFSGESMRRRAMISCLSKSVHMFRGIVHLSHRPDPNRLLSRDLMNKGETQDIIDHA